ncbi:MAG: hypothetical protein K8S00_02630 [Bacteroidales bacterium]|nr:hypothetical protein [Bacteroidales bacterium]
MKKYSIVFALCLFCMTLLPTESSAVEIGIYGKAGAYYQNGKWKVCPGFRLKKCATLNISWQEIKDWVFGSEQAPSGIVEVYDNEGAVDYIISVTVVGINSNITNSSSPPEYINGDDIIFE